ncbi:Nuclear cap-binding protein subunit 1 [Cichlidogyrus casuarinus]|uniref:Nuclear cap-binding protein subunit 1 n=1 Tax=Cichlidogyrus casuarinus TaxID=1844966 RepID=A0ABD2Q6L4_9PLAT
MDRPKNASLSGSDNEEEIKQEPMDVPPIDTFETPGDKPSTTIRRREDDTPHGLRRMDETPHCINPSRMDTPHGPRPSSPSIRDELPRTKFDDDDDRNYARPGTDQPDSQEMGQNRTPSVARNPSPSRRGDDDTKERKMESDRVLQLCDGVQDLRIDVFMSALLYCGHKTISHTFSLIKRYTNVLKRLIPLNNMQAQIDCLQLVRFSWSRQTQMCVMVIDHLCRTGFIEPEAVIQWAYSDHMTSITFETDKDDEDEDFDIGIKEEDETIQWSNQPVNARPTLLEFYVWECLNGILARVGRRVKTVSEKLEQAKDALVMKRAGTVSTSESSSASSDDDSDEGKNTRRKVRMGARGRSRSVVTGGSSAVVARLNRERLAAVECQAACVQALLSNHAKLMLRVEQQMLVIGGANVQNDGLDVKPQVLESKVQSMRHIMFWLRGRLEQVLLDVSSRP